MEAPADLEAFCRREYPQLVGTLTMYCGDVHLAEELAQEALTRACERWSEVGDMAAPGAWVHRVAINGANSYWRRMRAARRARDHLQAQTVDAAHERDVAGDVALRDAVAELPDRQRAAVVLRYVAGLTAADTARALDTTDQAVRNLTHRATRTLRDRLGMRNDDTDREADRAS